jgi:hypothetical protein
MIAQWHNFFLTAGGGAAALAGLVFVAIYFLKIALEILL